MLSVVLIADVLFNQDFIIVGIGPPVASLAVLIAGLLVRSHTPKAGSALLVIGIGGLVLSALGSRGGQTEPAVGPLAPKPCPGG
jgi:hypothetical protein